MRIHWRVAAPILGLALAAGAMAQQPAEEVKNQAGVWVQEGKLQSNVPSQFSGTLSPGASSLKMEPGTTLKIHLPVEDAVKGAKFELLGAGPMAPDATVQLKINGRVVGSEIPP
ncbi:MAG: hypothetical protein HY303_03820, partial [Candidatus Wallbacteria bacterium]|nr:hypothetical protein [Candidatus Wallbacteria bacterium]